MWRTVRVPRADGTVEIVPQIAVGYNAHPGMADSLSSRAFISMPPPPNQELAEQLPDQRRSVDFDPFDIHLQQLLTMLYDKAIAIAPSGPHRWAQAFVTAEPHPAYLNTA